MSIIARKKRRNRGTSPKVSFRLARPLLRRVDSVAAGIFSDRSAAIRMLIARGLERRPS